MGAPRRSLAFVVLLVAAGLAGPRTGYAHDDLLVQLDHLDALATAQPQDVTLRLRHAELSRLAGDTAQAGRDLAQVEALSPRHPGLFLARAALAEDARDAVATERWLERFLAGSDGVDDATVARALAQRARARMARDDSTGAIADFDRAFATAPAARADWALARARLARREGAQAGGDALAGLERALARLPDEPALVFLAADLEAAAGQVEAAVARLDRLAERAERREAILTRAGDLCAAAGQRLEAEARWSEALRLLDQDRRGTTSREAQSLRRQLEAALSANTAEPGR